jgi:beta-phosphoglucomutase-like phosphatase (HAD superfamily)
MSRPILAIDADGVLVDLHVGYARAWQRAFGVYPAERDPQAYWPMDRWQVEALDAEQRLVLRAQFDEPFWASLPAIPGALDACLGGFATVHAAR